MLYAIVAALVIIVDQWVKYWVANNLEYGFGTKELIPNIISLVNVHNDGAAFSFLSGTGARIWFIALCGVFTVLVIIALATRLISGPVGRWSAVFVVAGGLSNCIDRILYGYVQDMFKLEFVNFAVFNVADIFITVFCIVFIIYVLVGERPHDDDEYEDDDDDYDDEDDDYDDEDDDDEPVRRKAKKPSRAARKAAALKAEEDDDDDEDEEEKAPAKVKAVEAKKPATRKERQAKYDADFEQYKAAKAARVAESAPVQKAAPAKKSTNATATASSDKDPFAEWDAANRKAGNTVASAPVSKSTVKTEDARVYTPAKQAAKPAAPAAAPASSKPASSKPASTSAASDEEFSLDDILAEFK